MNLENIKIGLCITGSFCTLNDNMFMFETLKNEGADLTAIFSESVKTSKNKFSTPNERYANFEKLTNKNVIDTIEKAEPIGPNKLFDILVVAPCTG